MSSVRSKKVSGSANAPYVGALLRLAHQVARSRLLQGLVDRGLGDIDAAYFSLFQYPAIDGMRPIALAKQLGVSKQALNHLLGQLEKLGYLQRRRDPESGHTLIHYTERGWLAIESNIASVRQLEAEWQRQLGKQRFADLKETLRELTGFQKDRR